jgi:Lar family restriction alleviation protein
MTEIELDRCPFCGGEARVLNGNFSFMASVECYDCGANVRAIDEEDAVSMAIDKWNKRVK